MIIEIRKAGFRNKGAELMLLAIIARLRAAYPDATLTITPSAPKGSEPFSKVTALGIYPKASLTRFGIEWGGVATLIPRRLRQRYGLVLDRDVDVVIDAAGFAYSDQWGDRPAVELARATRRWRRRGTKVILLPQAFGPFTDPVIRAAIVQAVDNADLEIILDDFGIKKADLRAGRYDSAEVKIFEVIHSNLALGIAKLKRGRIGEVKISEPAGGMAEFR
ncbi:MAG: polysaccharide pyruvyl transferase family protein, partial [Proteobacteria bacterium]|nr:polysaccharide pyruvyl transferase family protein [Pseudomonadota bacterium]